MSFTKEDLKDGMVCTMRDGHISVAFTGAFFSTRFTGGFAITENWDDGLLNSETQPTHDIMKITYGGKIVFEREEWRELTIDEAFELLKSDKAMEDCCIQGQGLRDGASVWGGFSISMIAPSYAEPFYSQVDKHGFAKFRIKK